MLVLRQCQQRQRGEMETAKIERSQRQRTRKEQGLGAMLVEGGQGM